jgi:hypothetical protein
MKESGKTIYMYALAALFVIGYFCLIGFILVRVIPTENKDIALMLFGTLTAAVASIISYFYGSSKSSADKNEMLYKSTPTEEKNINQTP